MENIKIKVPLIQLYKRFICIFNIRIFSSILIFVRKIKEIYLNIILNFYSILLTFGTNIK